jgi:dienelactone hydrolase
MKKQKTPIERLISNPVVQTLVIYISGSWIILEMTDYFIDHYNLAERTRDILLIVLLSGLPIALLMSYFINIRRSAMERLSGKKQISGGQRTKGKSRRFPRKPWFTFPFIVLILLFGFVVIRSLNRKAKVKWARTELLPEAEKLWGQLKIFEAYHTLQKAAKYVPDDPDYKALKEQLSTRTSILSDPLGAAVYIKDYSNPDDAWELLGITPIDSTEMPRFALYRFLMVKSGYDSVLACLNSNQDTLYVKLFTAGTIPEGMVHVPGVGYESVSNHLGEKRDFFIDKYEVTNRQYKQFIDNLGYRDQKYWKHVFEKDGQILKWEEAMKCFVDKTGRPGPSTWEAGDYPDGQANYPVHGISWYEAAAYATYAGKELPTVEHWETAAGFFAMEYWYFFVSKLYPFSNFRDKGPEPVGINHGLNPFGTYDLAGNVREWCWNKTQEGRLIRGGAWNDVAYMYGNWSQLSPFNRSSKNGFRCVVYQDRSKIPVEAFEPIEIEKKRNYAELQPVSDDIFEIYRHQFQYDDLALNANREFRDESPEDWIIEKFSFDAAYENERMIAYLFLPKNAEPPYQTMIFYPGSYAVNNSTFPDAFFHYFCDFLMKNGIAAVMPVYKSTYERRGTMPRNNHAPNESHLFTEYLIKWIKDLSRTIDYLATRPDFDAGKIGLYTHSWGGVIGAYIPAIEDRVRLCVHVLGGFWGQALPEADQINYLPRVTVPVLMMNGRYDMTFPFDEEVKPYFDFLGTPENDKVLKVYESDHWVPKNEMIRETLDWLEKYFGPVNK